MIKNMSLEALEVLLEILNESGHKETIDRKEIKRTEDMVNQSTTLIGTLLLL